MPIGRPSRLVVVAISANYGTGDRGTYEYDDCSKLYTSELAEELLQLTIEETHVVMYPEGYKVAWLVDILTDRLKPKILICENILLLENNDCGSLSLKIRFILENQKDIKEESYVLVVVVYYPKCKPPPGGVDLTLCGWKEVKNPNNHDNTSKSMTWFEFVTLTDC